MSSRRKNKRLAVESLESRHLMASLVGAQIEYLDAESCLVINGSDGNDTIDVSSTKNGQISVKVNKATLGTFSPFELNRLVICGNLGNDKITVQNKVALEALIRGGAGNDTIKAGGGSAVIYGGDGQDKLTAGTKDSLLYGNAGKDTLTGGAADDILHGGEGNDTIKGAKGRNFLLGGGGKDKITATKTDKQAQDPLALMTSENYAHPYSILHWSQGIAQNVNESLDAVWTDVVEVGKQLYDWYGDYEMIQGITDIVRNVRPDPLWVAETFFLGGEIPLTDIEFPGLFTHTEAADATMSGNMRPSPSPWAFFETTLPNPSSPADPWYFYEDLFNQNSSSYYHNGSNPTGVSFGYDDNAPKSSWSNFDDWFGNNYYGQPDPFAVDEIFFSPLPGFLSDDPIGHDYLSDPSNWWTEPVFPRMEPMPVERPDYWTGPVYPPGNGGGFDIGLEDPRYHILPYPYPMDGSAWAPEAGYGNDPWYTALEAAYGGSSDPWGYGTSNGGYDMFGGSSDPFGGYGSYDMFGGYSDPFGGYGSTDMFGGYSDPFGGYGSYDSTYGMGGYDAWGNYAGYDDGWSSAIDTSYSGFTPGFFDNLGWGSNMFIPDGTYLGTWDDTRHYEGGYRLRVIDGSTLYGDSWGGYDSGYDSYGDYGGYGDYGSYGDYGGYGGGYGTDYSSLLSALENAQNAYNQRYDSDSYGSYGGYDGTPTFNNAIDYGEYWTNYVRGGNW